MSEGFVSVRLGRSTGFTLEATFTIPESGVTVLFGPSGCGKTTVLRSIAGLEKAAGKVVVAGHVWQDDEKKIFVPTHQRRLGYVFQEASLFEHLSVRQNLEYGLKRIKDANGEERLRQAVELLGIGHLLTRTTGELSGGERQRCAIARSLAVRPTALLMDEPLAALDNSRRREIMPWLENLRRELNIPIIYVTHSEDELMRLGDTLVLMDSGKIVAAGPVQEVLTKKEVALGFEKVAAALCVGRVAEVDSAWGLSRIDVNGTNFWVTGTKFEVGSERRLSIRARDVLLSLVQPQSVSIQNVVPCRILSISEAKDPSEILVRLDCNGVTLLSLITRKAQNELSLSEGQNVWAQVKSVAIVG